MIQINQDKCIQCELCINDCVEKNIKNRKGVITPISDCMECGHCVAICPQNAISIDGYDMSQLEEISSEKFIKADTLLYSIKARRSIRKFKPNKLTEEQIHSLSDAIRYTATAKNLQDTTVLFVQDRIKEFENEIYRYLDSLFEDCDVKSLDSAMAALYLFAMRHRRNPADDFLLRQAPAVLILANDRPWDARIDAGMAAQNVELMAGAQGLGVLYNGYLSRLIDSSDTLKKWLGIEGKSVSIAMLVGQPAVKYQRTTPRKEVNLIRL